MKPYLLFVAILASCRLDMTRAYGTCHDDPHYRYGGFEFKDCDWIKANKKCHLSMDDGMLIGAYYCSVSCGQCPDDVTIDSISVHSSCYEYGEDILASFTNKEPREDDWVAIYPASADPTHLGFSALWLWLCGTQNHFCKVLYGMVNFGAGPLPENGTDSSPIPAGTYKAFLVRRNSGGPYSSYAESTNFVVKPAGQSCNSPPTPMAPYPAPQPAPQPGPQPGPTPNCDEIIYTNKDCYVKGEAIAIFFAQCAPQPDDSVAVYYSTADDDDLGENYRLWVWACGDQVCQGKAEVGAITFDDSNSHEAGTDVWPLNPSPVGYRVHLIRRNSGGPNVSYARSNLFYVVDGHETCGGTPPAPQPALYPAPQPTPQPAPHPAPYPAPQPAPHPGPTEQCENSVNTDAACYVEGNDEITIAFDNCNAQAQDWIGIYDADDHPVGLGYPLLWVWACGSQTCMEVADSGNIVFGPGHSYETGHGAWPLDDGHYRAHLIHGSSPTGHNVARASSEAFSVDMSSCTSTPDGYKGRKGSKRRQRRRIRGPTE
jgi:hypothetical protein